MESEQASDPQRRTPAGADEGRFEVLFQRSPDAALLLAGGVFVDCNHAAVELLRCASKDDILGRHPAELSAGSSEDGADAFLEADAIMATALAEGSARFEWRIRRADGEVFPAEVSITAYPLNGSRILHVAARDITDRKRAETALLRANAELERRVAERTAELDAARRALAAEVAQHEAASAELRRRTEELEAVFQALPDLFFRLTRDGTVLEHRSGGRERSGLPPELYLGRPLADLLTELRVPEETGARVREALAEVHRTGEPVSFEYTLEVDGAASEFEARLVRLEDESLIAIVRDITGRKVAEREMERREEHFRRLIENASDMVQLISASGEIQYTGPSVYHLLGYTPDEIAGTDPMLYIHPDDLQATATALGEMLQSPDVVRGAKYRVRHKQGHYLQFEAFARTLAPDSAAAGVVVNARDITERHQAELALRQASREAEQAREAAEHANRAKSEFLSRMSHELRTPMNSILGFAQLLDRAPLPPEHKKGVGHILKGGRHLLKLINEVLEIARIEAGRHALSLEPVEVGPVLQEAVALVRPLAAQWRVELDEGPWACGGAFVQADRQRLTQVLLNLLGNAIKYNRPGGRVWLGCEPLEAGGEPRGLVVRVRDTGRGIPRDRIEQLFTPFARLGAEQSEIEGTGLGLALSQRLAEAMGGTLALESTGGEGSVFRLELPILRDPLQRLADQSAPESRLEDVPHAPAKLLYIEDNLANLSLVETILLSRPNWRTLSALQGLVGIELAREHAPDLVLLDLHLPDVSGEEVLRRLRAEPRTASVPVVVITADATRSTAERLRGAGADAYLTKPLDVDEFLQTLEQLLPAPADRVDRR